MSAHSLGRGPSLLKVESALRVDQGLSFQSRTAALLMVGNDQFVQLDLEAVHVRHTNATGRPQKWSGGRACDCRRKEGASVQGILLRRGRNRASWAAPRLEP
ncbi:predicted protein [Streptomyces iranensis]|uniref:Uncharacterized protein n=1 Tax=Streptomyces iranensis TaxID=576784 RepID=A0A060ZUP1_9ACTN|nr:predicted protein [Streptomyces iranensis]